MDFDPDAPVINATAVDHHCFGCGAMNPNGLHLRFREAPGGGVWAGFAPDRRYEGYLGMIHGGILTTMLDEAMSWAITASGDFAVTARLEVTFRAPAQVAGELRVEGRVGRARKRVIDTTGRVVCVETGRVIAEAEGRFVRVSEDQARAWRDAYGDVERSERPEGPIAAGSD